MAAGLVDARVVVLVTTHEWKPGDVALVPFLFGERVCVYTPTGWVGGPETEDDGHLYVGARRVVVIDYENVEQVRRLILALDEAFADGDRDDWPEAIALTQAALREFANPASVVAW